ncbi:MAG TPA: protein translocase subunit SecD [Bryobacteraceae bacterium]|nr:protein translocase subunit SecD [Bryobacteraceae bacterium]
MQRSLRIRMFVIAGIIVLCLYGIFGIPLSGRQLARNIRKHIRLGLDLKGGTQLLLEVQIQDAFKAEADTIINRLKDRLAASGIAYSSISRNDPETIQQAASTEVDVRGVSPTSAGDFQSTAQQTAGPGWIVTAVNATDYRLTMRPEYAAQLEHDTMAQTINTLARKVNALGLSEASVQGHGGKGSEEAEVLIQLPGISDPQRVKQILKTAAVLNLDQVLGGPFASPADAMASVGGILPLNSAILGGSTSGGQPAEYWILARSPVITGKDLRDARATLEPSRGWETEFFLSEDSAARFQRFTGTHIGQRLAIVLDKVVLSAPVIQGQIGDSGVIEGLSGHQEAADLALNLRSGSLPAAIEYLQQDTVGPSLGADSIRDGSEALIAGVIAVTVGLLIYYRRAGINAILSLLLNGIILVAALSYAGAVLTLPGIAGVILTVGMAVDANVLIFERIREELRAGKAAIQAVDAGFRHAFKTIVDTHVTTMVSCAFLFEFGAGPVRGFAVTLLIGLAANAFTAVFVSRTIFDWELSQGRHVATLGI